jgi:glycosyltransferase involved in cell wall biosynthesis
LASAINQLAADSELRKRLGKQGREYIVQRFSRAGTAQKYIHVLQQLVRESPAAVD